MANSPAARAALVANLFARAPSVQTSTASSPFRHASFSRSDPLPQIPIAQPVPHLHGGGLWQHSPAAVTEAKLGRLVYLPVDRQHHAKRQV